MKRLIAVVLAIMILAVLAGCTPGNLAEESTAVVQTEPSVEKLTGWQTVNGELYCFGEDGMPVTGWRSDLPGGNGGRGYLDENGKALTGWQEIGGKRYYFEESGTMLTGWLEDRGEHYYFGIDGVMFTGLLNIQGKGYYFDEEGKRSSGWLEMEDKTYYFGQDGVMAVGPTEIEGQTHYFSPHGVEILLVNPWNALPEGYTVELVTFMGYNRLETECAEALQRMIADCEAAGHDPEIASAYRTQEEQEYLFERKVKYYTGMGWSRSNAEREAAKEIAYPGTSEHQLGLAVDLMDSDYPYLNDYQATTDTQIWLMENCHTYGFILRYPVEATEITGIIYEPWHYRYVGPEIAQEIVNLGITLEEYLGAA